MEDELIFVGEVIRPQGTKGEMKVLPLTTDPRRYDLLKEIWLIKPDCAPVLKNIQKVRYHKNFVLLKLAGFDTPDQVKQQVGARLGIPGDLLLPLESDTYYQHDIIGLKVYTAEKRYLGKVERIFPTGGNDVYIVKNGPQEFLIPAIKQAIKEIDLKKGHIILKNLAGLIDPMKVN
jgi:16S rRNA processing protein RimM